MGDDGDDDGDDACGCAIMLFVVDHTHSLPCPLVLHPHDAAAGWATMEQLVLGPVRGLVVADQAPKGMEHLEPLQLPMIGQVQLLRGVAGTTTTATAAATTATLPFNPKSISASPRPSKAIASARGRT